MKPWDIIGWAVISLFVLWFVLFLFGTLLKLWGWLMVLAGRTFLHRATRNTAPMEGQLWMNGDVVLQILKVHDNGNVTIKGGARGALWTETAETWLANVKANKRYLQQGQGNNR